MLRGLEDALKRTLTYQNVTKYGYKHSAPWETNALK